jgi:hypothetical protein
MIRMVLAWEAKLKKRCSCCKKLCVTLEDYGGYKCCRTCCSNILKRQKERRFRNSIEEYLEQMLKC